MRAAGLNSLEWRVLATLSDCEPLTVGELALEVLAQQPTVTKSIDRLAAQGWLLRHADAARHQRSDCTATSRPNFCSSWREKHSKLSAPPTP